MPHVLLNGSFRDANAELQQLTTDPFSSPEPILRCHFLDQRHCLFRYFRLERSCSGFVLPEEPKTLAMPPQERLWLNNQQCLFPGSNHPCEKHQEHAICSGTCRSFDGYCLSWWWIIRSTSANTLRAGFFVMRQSGQATSSWSEGPSDFSCWHVHRPPHDITLPPYLA